MKNLYSLSNISWLLTLIHRLRPDLCQFYPQKHEEKLKFILWLICNESEEARLLRYDKNFQFFLNNPIRGLGLTPLQGLIYFERRDIQNQYPLFSHRKEFIFWFYKIGVKEHKLWNLLSIEEQKAIKTSKNIKRYNSN